MLFLCGGFKCEAAKRKDRMQPVAGPAVRAVLKRPRSKRKRWPVSSSEIQHILRNSTYPTQMVASEIRPSAPEISKKHFYNCQKNASVSQAVKLLRSCQRLSLAKAGLAFLFLSGLLGSVTRAEFLPAAPQLLLSGSTGGLSCLVGASRVQNA